MNPSYLSSLGACAVMAGMLAGCARPSDAPPVAQPAAVEPTQEATGPGGYTAKQMARGAELVGFGACNDCHTPWAFREDLGMPVPDMSRMLSGHPEGAPGPSGQVGPTDIVLIGPTFTSFRMPFGTVYSVNLTPDMDTGTGSWTEQMFVDIFKKGRHLGGDGRGILPPMPWVYYRTLPEKDLVAIFAYLRSIPPIRNSVPSPEVPEEVIWALRDSFDKLVAESSGQP